MNENNEDNCNISKENKKIYKKLSDNKVIMKSIISRLEVVDLISIQFVCKQWYILSTSNVIWLEAICKHLFSVYCLMYSVQDGILHSPQYSEIESMVNNNSINSFENYSFKACSPPPQINNCVFKNSKSCVGNFDHTRRNNIFYQFEFSNDLIKSITNLPQHHYKNTFMKIFYQYYQSKVVADKYREFFRNKLFAPCFDTVFPNLLLMVTNDLQSLDESNQNSKTSKTTKLKSNLDISFSPILNSFNQVLKDFKSISTPVYSQFSIYKTNFKQRELYFKSNDPLETKKTTCFFILLNNQKNQFQDNQNYNCYKVETEFILFNLFQNNTEYEQDEKLISSLKSVQFKLAIYIKFQLSNRSIVHSFSNCKYKLIDYSDSDSIKRNDSVSIFSEDRNVDKWNQLYDFNVKLNKNNGVNGVFIGDDDQQQFINKNKDNQYYIKQYESHSEYSSIHFPVDSIITDKIGEYLSIDGTEVINTISTVLEHRKFQVQYPKKSMLLNYQLSLDLYLSGFYNNRLIFGDHDIVNKIFNYDYINYIGFCLLKSISYDDETIICDGYNLVDGQVKKELTLDILDESYCISSDIKRSIFSGKEMFELYLTISDFKLIIPPILIKSVIIGDIGSGSGDAGENGILFSISYVYTILKFLNLNSNITPSDKDYQDNEKANLLVMILQLLLFIWRLNQYIRIDLVDNDKFKFTFINNNSSFNNNNCNKKRLNNNNAGNSYKKLK